MLASNLACGPMSPEIVEAVFLHSHKHNTQLMLICSRNQVDVDSGYVFTTRKYMEYILLMKARYRLSDVVICRDHCGPGFGSYYENDLEGTKRTIRCDLEHGFDLIHIDLCLATDMSHSEKLEHTLALMRYALSIRSDVMFEIGTDENVGITEDNVERIVSDIRICQRAANPVFYVVQTGSLVLENFNTGSFMSDVVGRMKQAINQHGISLKEHNADYLTKEQLKLRNGTVDAVNIAPQLGVVQTSHILSQALIYGISTEPFVQKVLDGKRWKKWTGNSSNHLLCATIAGHYHFDSPEYQNLMSLLNDECDIRNSIAGEITRVIEHYLFALECK